MFRNEPREWESISLGRPVLPSNSVVYFTSCHHKLITAEVRSSNHRRVMYLQLTIYIVLTISLVVQLLATEKRVSA